MKIIFMGTPAIAVPALEKLIHSRHEVVLVVTQPDQVSGRGMNVRFSPVKETALRFHIPCLQPEKINDPAVLDSLDALNADICAVAAYAQKIPDRLLEMQKFGCINMHPSLLPKYRGSGPLRGPILNGDEKTGVTIMQLVSAWDAGDILLQEEFPMDPKETAKTLEEKCSRLGADLMLRTIDGLEEGIITPKPQDPEKATYLKQITKEAGRICFDDPAVMIERQIRALNPWPSAFTTLNGKMFKIWEARVFSEEEAKDLFSEKGVTPAALRNGETAYADRKEILIKAAEGFLSPLLVQMEGKKKMTMEEFLRGKKIEQGFMFGC